MALRKVLATMQCMRGPAPQSVGAVGRLCVNRQRICGMVLTSDNDDEEVRVRRRKAELRKEVSARVDALDEEEILRQSADVTRQVLQRPEYQRARSVAVYLSFEKEVRTDALVQDILRSGRTCYIPRFRAGHPEMEMVHLASEEALHALPVNRWGIRQHADDDAGVRSVFDAGRPLDAVLMPGQAFTADGRRLGRGKGYYDRFLARCKEELPAPPPATLALAFREQLLPDLPTTPRDVRVDAVLYQHASPHS